MDFYRDKALLWRNIYGCMSVFVFFTFFYFVGLKKDGMLSVKLMLVLAIFFSILFVGTALLVLILSISWLLVKKPALSITRSSVVIREYPWSEVTLNPKEILSFQYDVRQAIRKRKIEYTPELTINIKAREAIVLELTVIDGTADDIYAALEQYQPTIAWHE